MVGYNLACFPMECVYSALVPLVFMTIAGFTMVQVGHGIIMCLFGAFAFSGFSKLIALGCSSMDVSVRIAPVCLVVMTLYSGFLIREYDLPSWISWAVVFSPYRWFMFGLGLIMFEPNSFTSIIPNEFILGINGVSSRSITECRVKLLVFGFVTRFLGGLIYSWKLSKKH